MEWSLTQNKLLAFHRLMRTDKPIGALLLLWPTLWALWVATPGVPSSGSCGVCRGCLADARCRMCGE
ncbi:4-hydroxybenzoate octaprenyltransferase [Escherichia coli]|nr:4-hydroxybenzoate octaprenyltransferase [Escherichia coli]